MCVVAYSLGRSACGKRSYRKDQGREDTALKRRCKRWGHILGYCAALVDFVDAEHSPSLILYAFPISRCIPRCSGDLLDTMFLVTSKPIGLKQLHVLK